MTPKPKKKTVASLLRQIEICKTRIGEERDKLRALIDDADELAENCDEAIDSMDDAVTKLSELA